MNNLQQLRDNHALVLPKADRMKDALLAELGHAVDSLGITLGVPLEGRTKTWTSFEEKLARKSLTIESASDLDDLIGIRIILLFRQDIQEVDKLIHNTLNVIRVEDVSQRMTDSQFGYQSQHYIADLPKTWLAIPRYTDLTGLRVEIQLRTLAQHIWAAASHKLQYKHEASVPLPLRRSIYRASALLETVDLEFERLLQERSTYVKNETEDATPTEKLNVDLLKSILSEILPAENKRRSENYDDLLVDLNAFGFDTPIKLRCLLEKQMQKVLADEALQGKKPYYHQVGLARVALRFEVGKKLDEFATERKAAAAKKRKPAAKRGAV